MAEHRKKTKKGTPPLKPLAPDAAARLQEQLAGVREALAAGEDLEDIKARITPEADDLLWNLHLINALAQIRDKAVAPLLAAFFGKSPDKEINKALKRALHVLKTRGVAVPEDILPREEARPRLLAPSPAALAYVSQIFGDGERYVVLEGPKEFLGRGNVLLARLSDVHGFRECHLLSVTRKQREELWDHLREQGLGDFAEVPPAYAVRLLEDAFNLDFANEAALRYSPLRSLIWQHWGLPESPEKQEDRLPALGDTERRLYLERSKQLARTEIFQSWLPSMEEVGVWVKKVQEAQESPLVLAEHQQQARYEQILSEAALALYPPESRPRWSRRLLEMAYFLDLKGLAEEARAARAAADDLAGEAASPLRGENPFLLGLVTYAVQLGLEYLKQTEAKAPSGLVTLTGEPLIR
ncbi:MAG: hypothetical protein QME75_00870 [Deltaproteobacteria bacterium]|nr:hypothetical protein [Deltaproteobacteria bacterium]